MFHIFFHSFAGDQEPDSKKRRYRRKEEEDEGQIVEYDDGKSKICIKYRSNQITKKEAKSEARVSKFDWHDLCH